MFFKLPEFKLLKAPIHEVIVPDEDYHIFNISHPQHLKLIASPLASEQDIHHDQHSHPELKSPTVAVHELKRNSNASSNTQRELEHEHNHDHRRDVHPDEPVLKRAHEASTIQLFFDLFFVANLTTFTSIHEIDTFEALKSYLGYFAVIWFTWFENTLFDVRFSNDSAFERVCKAAQFGVMAGFAVIGPGFQTGVEAGTREAAAAISTFKALSFILMTSRLILTFQYGVALVWLKPYKKAHLPMLGHMATLFASAMIFLGLTFAFTGDTATNNVLIAWYFIVAVEALVIMIISGNVQFLSFRKTVLVERLGLLTLIILGEGIIGMMSSINKLGSDNWYPSDIIGQILCSVVITYSLWMLYFDQVQPERMGTLRQNIWAILHFPFHVCILLVVEGMARLSVWRKVIDVTNPLEEIITSIQPGKILESQIAALNQTLIDLFERFPDAAKPDLSAYWADISESSASAKTIQEGINGLYADGVNFTLTNFKITPPSDVEEGIGGILELFEVIFIYFFVFAGFTLILLAVLFTLGKRRKLRGELLSVAMRIFFGLLLSLLALMAVGSLGGPTDYNNSLHKYMFSAWMLPTVLIVYLIVIVADNLLIRYVKSVVHWRMKHGQKTPTPMMAHTPV